MRYIIRYILGNLETWEREKFIAYLDCMRYVCIVCMYINE